MEGNIPNSLARGKLRLAPLRSGEQPLTGADVVQLHMAANQGADNTEPNEKATLPIRRVMDRNINVKDISTDFRVAASGLSLHPFSVDQAIVLIFSKLWIPVSWSKTHTSPFLKLSALLRYAKLGRGDTAKKSTLLTRAGRSWIPRWTAAS